MDAEPTFADLMRQAREEMGRRAEVAGVVRWLLECREKTLQARNGRPGGTASDRR